jgi:aspartyl-tRNA(Asn)/glutamyl-tRNA(Gln) amidotransferase subunit A
MDSIFFHRHPATAAPGDGPLQGLTVAVASGFSAAGWPTDAGSKALEGFTALEDATVVQRLRTAGAHLCGSLLTSEFGFGLHGSQAGEACRQGAADVELVLDLMGESRLAARRAGVCGFKPSYGLVSRFGLIGSIPSMECCGILSGSLVRIRQVLQTVAGQDQRDLSLPGEPLPDFAPREIVPDQTPIGVIKEVLHALPAQQEGEFLESVGHLRQAGFPVREVSLPEFSLGPLVHEIVGSVEASSCAGRYDSVRYGSRVPGAKNWNDMYLLARGAAFGPLVKSYLFQGAYFQFERYAAYEGACRIRARLLAEMQRLTSQVGFLVLPAGDGVAAASAATLADTYAQFAWTALANVTGQPALYLPDATGLADAGMQLVGARSSDGRLLALGEHLRNIRQKGQE